MRTYKVINENHIWCEGKPYIAKPSGDSCAGCSFEDRGDCNDVPCIPRKRTDGKLVVFVRNTIINRFKIFLLRLIGN